MVENMNQRSVFWAAFCAGLAAPVGLFSPPTPYVLNLGVYSIADSFAQVGMTLSQASAPIFDDGPFDGIEYSDLAELHGEFGDDIVGSSPAA
jgi:hypothetical protein